MPHPITTNASSANPDNWQAQLRNLIRDPLELYRLLELPTQALPLADSGGYGFPLRVPRGFVARMRKGDPGDPLLRQVLPLREEGLAVPGFGTDPLGEREGGAECPGLLHKYHGRALLIISPACAVHCRYCFRRHFPYGEQRPAPPWGEVLAYLRAHESINEIIYSGGDPLSAPDSLLAQLTRKLAALPQLQRLRIHTRLPVLIPERVTAQLLSWLRETRLQPVMVLHTNHANEINAPVEAALGRLQRCGITLLNQAVLLRGVNDNVEALAALSERLFRCGVLPYYLHLLDPVAGSAHFQLGARRAQELVGELAKRLPGYLVPRLAREVPGLGAKQQLPPLL